MKLKTHDDYDDVHYLTAWHCISQRNATTRSTSEYGLLDRFNGSLSGTYLPYLTSLRYWSDAEMEIIRFSGVYTLRLLLFSLSGLVSSLPDCLPCILHLSMGI